MFQSFIIFYLSLLGISFAQTVPVVLWGESTPLKPTLQTVQIDTFGNLIAPYLEDSMILAFLENDLELTDLSMCKTKSDKSCFKNIGKFELKNYYADVELPVNALTDIAHKKQFVNLDVNGKTNEPINYETGKIVFVKLDDSVKDRSEALSKHDSAIGQIYNEISKNGKTLGIYTSDKKYLSRKVRAAPKIKSTILTAPGKFLLAFKELKLKEDSKDPEPVTLNKLELVKENKTVFTYSLSGSHSIQFDVHRNRGYWKIKNLSFKDEPMNVVIEAADLFSYYCGTNVFHNSNRKIKLMWSGLQMEPNFNAKITGDFKFHDPWHCVGFTSPAILMGIFVTLLFLFIISIGVTSLMSINTMDRFDDPKGKSITINASD